ncbi:MAG: DUF3604 domain-containing protein [Acidimicrobiia bacterium]
MTRRGSRSIAVAAAIVLASPAAAGAQDVTNPASLRPAAREYSPYLNHNYPDRVLWGDTHLHTSYSTDAGLFGNRIGPDEAYRFAKGEVVTSSTGVRARLLRPLDWLVVSDHAENLGLVPLIVESNPGLLATEWGRAIHDLYKAGDPGGAYTMWGAGVTSGKIPWLGTTR